MESAVRGLGGKKKIPKNVEFSLRGNLATPKVSFGGNIERKTKINSFFEKFSLPQVSFWDPLLKKFPKNVDFNVILYYRALRQTLHCPAKWTFFRVLAHCAFSKNRFKIQNMHLE